MWVYKHISTLHLVEWTRWVRSVPNIFPHLELGASLLNAKQVDPHLTIAVKGDRLGKGRNREFDWIHVSWDFLVKGVGRV